MIRFHTEILHISKFYFVFPDDGISAMNACCMAHSSPGVMRPPRVNTGHRGSQSSQHQQLQLNADSGQWQLTIYLRTDDLVWLKLWRNVEKCSTLTLQSLRPPQKAGGVKLHANYSAFFLIVLFSCGFVADVSWPCALLLGSDAQK